MSAGQKLRVAAATVNLAVALAKTVADQRRHRSHEEHDSRCRCLLNCTPCMTDALLGR